MIFSFTSQVRESKSSKSTQTYSQYSSPRPTAARILRIYKHSFIQKSFFPSSHLPIFPPFYIYIDTYVGICASFVFPMKNLGGFAARFSFTVVALSALTSHHTRLRSQSSTPRRGPDSTPDAQLFPSSYRPGTTKSIRSILQLHFQASFFAACSVIFVILSTLSLIPRSVLVCE